MPSVSNFATFVAKLRKKVEKSNYFGKINTRLRNYSYLCSDNKQ